jgi:hypothetical protein
MHDVVDLGVLCEKAVGTVFVDPVDGRRPVVGLVGSYAHRCAVGIDEMLRLIELGCESQNFTLH